MVHQLLHGDAQLLRGVQSVQLMTRSRKLRRLGVISWRLVGTVLQDSVHVASASLLCTLVALRL